jgi:hypothetical protein
MKNQCALLAENTEEFVTHYDLVAWEFIKNCEIFVWTKFNDQ